MNYWLLLIPVFSAFTGWLTIHIAIRFLFHPVRPRKMARIRIQGVFPARQQQLATRIGDVVNTFFSMDQVEEKISNPENLKKILPMIEAHIDDFLRNKLGKELPMIGMFIGDKTVGKVKEAFMKEIELLFPQIMKEYAANMKKDLDIRQKVIEMISSLSPETAEKMLLDNAGPQLRLARLGGLSLGFLLGLLQLAILLLV